jgi:hypothetical protein
MQPGAERELRTADIGDERLDERCKTLLDRLSRKPSAKFPAACRGWAEVKAAYRFLNNPRVGPEVLLAPHRDATLERIRAYPVVVVAQGTSEADLTRRHEVVAGAGPRNDASRRGLSFHPLLALTPQRLPLGVVAATTWARDAEGFQKPAAPKAAERKAKGVALGYRITPLRG